MNEHTQCYECITTIENVKTCIRKGHPLLILMRGIPGSGKSYLARELLSLKSGGIICSTDSYFEKNGEYIFNHGLLNEYHGKNINRARDAITDGITPVIIDNTNICIEYMKPYALHAATAGYEIYIVEPNNNWSRKAGQCAIKNCHGVSKIQILHMLNQLDDNNDPSLQVLLGKNYNINLQLNNHNPPSEKMLDLLVDDNNMTISGLGTPLGLPIQEVPSYVISLAPKSTKIQVREIGIQADEISVALSICGFFEFVDDVEVHDYYDKLAVKCETKERSSQKQYNSTDREQDDLDFLVSIYPGENMFELYHSYKANNEKGNGLHRTICMYIDSGIWPDYTASIEKGAFIPEIALALESGSSEFDFKIDSLSDNNTYSSGPDDIIATDNLYEVDIGMKLFKQLENHFGSMESFNYNQSTKAYLSETILLQIYNAVLSQRSAASNSSNVISDEEYARRLQEDEDELARQYERQRSDNKQMTSAQYLQFKNLQEKFPYMESSALHDFYRANNYNHTNTDALLSMNGYQAQSLSSSNVQHTPGKIETKVVKSQSATISSESSYSSQDIHAKGFEDVYRKARSLIEAANEYKEIKEKIVQDTYRLNTETSNGKNYHAVLKREEASKYAKLEKDTREEAMNLLIEANRKSAVLDLHFMTPKAAITIVRERLGKLDRDEQYRSGPSKKKLTIITGYGKTSGEKGIIKNVIVQHLKNKKYSFWFPNKGSIEVQCK